MSRVRLLCGLVFVAAMVGGLAGCSYSYERNGPPPGPYDRYTGERIPRSTEESQYWGYPHDHPVTPKY